MMQTANDFEYNFLQNNLIAADAKVAVAQAERKVFHERLNLAEARREAAVKASADKLAVALGHPPEVPNAA